jgi:hypothetical protein
LATDTFGETSHFETLHKDSSAKDFYGNVQMYGTYKRNHRMVLCRKTIDLMRRAPKEKWQVLNGCLPVYFILPNTIINMLSEGAVMVRAYPKGIDALHSYSQINYYVSREGRKMIEDAGAKISDLFAMLCQGFGAIIDHEDYRVAASSHIGARSGAIEHFTFGRNEPALHHYHNGFNESLGLDPLEQLEPLDPLDRI